MKVEKIWLTDTEVWITTADGRTAVERFADYARLRDASQEQREAYTSDAFGIHWEELDEDLSFEGFFHKGKRNILYRIFSSHPELKASAVAARMGITQSLFAQYIGGNKVPSAQRLDKILSTIEEIGHELASIRSQL